VVSTLTLVLACSGAAGAQETQGLPVTIEGQTVRLVMRIHTPAIAGRLPTLVFNHGSTGTGRDPGIAMRVYDAPEVAKFFVDRGFAVVLPSRRGRGGSDGFYDEGFGPNRAEGYSCNPLHALAGADRALVDIEAAVEAILAMPFVDRARLLIGGQSRGGILSVAYAGRHPDQVKGVVNFVGGWTGARCGTDASHNNQALVKRGGRFPGETLWLYGDQDPFYSLAHSRENFEAFRAAGGRGTFLEFQPPPNFSGHRIGLFPDLWSTDLDAYLKRIGLLPR
jgi:dienelactone hydrolase